MEYLSANKKIWDGRVETHMASEFYDNESFLKGRNSLNKIELDVLGDIRNQSIAHLQCHFGQDSLSMARMGAKVTGVDLSDKAIEQAKQLNQQLELDAEFHCSDILSYRGQTEAFDIVFASYGVLGWHPNITAWFKVASELLKSGGRMVLVEFHPVLWMFDATFHHIEHSYFNRDAIVEQVTDSYTDGSELEEPLIEYGWNHSLSDVFNALKTNGLQLQHFEEHDYSSYNCFHGCVKADRGFQIESLQGKLPMVYAIEAIKR